MTPALAGTRIEAIRALLAEKGYDVAEAGANMLTIREVHSGVAIHAALEGDVLFLSMNCVTVPQAAITLQVMRTMLAADNGISTSHFQLYDTGGGNIAVTLNNFCKLQDMGPEDQDDVLSCVHFLLIDVMEARRLLGGLLTQK